MITYIFFILNTFLFTWYSSKLLRDVSGRDQYWHIPQVIMLISFHLMPLSVASNILEYLIQICLYGLMFPLLFNTGLNLYRISAGARITWKHTGRYDFLSFTQSVILFSIGLTLIIGFEVWMKKYIQ